MDPMREYLSASPETELQKQRRIRPPGKRAAGSGTLDPAPGEDGSLYLSRSVLADQGAVSGSEERMIRDLNDRVYGLLKDVNAPRGEFDCECGDQACGRSVELTLREYETLRVHESRPVLSPEHT